MKMYSLLQLLCVALCASVGLINAACPFKAEITKVEPCDKKQPDLYALSKPYSFNLVNDNCDFEVTGCIQIHQDAKSAKIKWTAWHNNNKVSTGEKDVCNFKMENLEVKCPLRKGKTMCAKSDMVKNPVGPAAVGMLTGAWKMKTETVTDAGVVHCLMSEARLVKV